MSRTYDIQRWDGIILPSLNVPQPGLYIQPDKELIQLLSQRKVLGIKIKNTDSIYENRLANAVVRPSAVTGGLRPNFQDKTGLVVVLPAIAWEGYPNALGQVEILDFVEVPTPIEEPFQTIQTQTRCDTTPLLAFVMSAALLYVMAQTLL